MQIISNRLANSANIMSKIDYIINLCHELEENGKTPSMALIRNLSTKPLAIPDVIKGLKHYKTNTTTKRSLPLEEADLSAELSLEQRVENLEQQLATVLTKLESLSSPENT